MAFNLIETVKDYFSNDFTNQASSALGENNSGISKALSAIIPTGLAGIVSKATSGPDGATSIFNMAKNAIGNVTGTATPAAGTNVEVGKGMLSNLFGNNQSGIVSAISKFAGIKDSSASSLMSMGIPAIMGLLGKHAQQNNLNPDSLSGLLASQKDNIMQAMPAGLSSLTGMLGLGSMGAAAKSMTSNLKSDLSDKAHAVSDRTHEVIDKPSGNKWLWPLIIILAVIALIWLFSKGCNNTPADVTNEDTSAVMHNRDTAAALTAPVVVGHESIKVTLPNGTELDAYKGGIEDQLVTFLNSDWKSLSDSDLKAKWFDFDNLNFNTGNATLVAESEKQLDNLAEILKAFPDAKLKIGGYTDASGNADANKKLSQERADAAKAGLEKRGVGKQVTGAEGYGSQFAKAAADAPDSERAADRHVSVSVRK